LSNLDEALARFAQCGVEYASGFSNHGPMAAEALEALGHASLIPTLVDIYAPRLPDHKPGEIIAPESRESALGVGARGSDWIATFEALLADQPYAQVLSEWLPRLLPGFFAAAAHGPLRAAHAARALAAVDNAVRRRELAFGLGYWASRYQRLPGDPGSAPRSGLGPRALLCELPMVEESRRRYGLFSEAVLLLEDEPAFARAIAALDLDALDLDAFVSELCVVAAELYLAHPDWRIAYAHCVTAPSALRLLARYLDADGRRQAAGYALQTVAALHATHGRAGALDAPPQIGEEVRRVAESREETRYRAACSVEEHSIKLTEACLREDAICPDERLRLCAADAALEIGASHAARG